MVIILTPKEDYYMRLFVEKPHNSNGYRFYSAVVIGGEIDGDEIIVQEPEIFFVHHPRRVSLSMFQEVSSEAGPPRIPKIQEHEGDCNDWRDDLIKRFAIN